MTMKGTTSVPTPGAPVFATPIMKAQNAPSAHFHGASSGIFTSAGCHQPPEQCLMTVLTTASTAVQLPFRENRFLQRTSAAMLLVILVSAIRPDEVDDWFMENSLVFVFLGVLAYTYRRLSFSQASYLLLFAFLVFHEWGAHYKYSDV